MVCFLARELVVDCDDRLSFRALCAPGWLRKWHAAVRVTKSRKMVGFISAVPIRMKVYEK